MWCKKMIEDGAAAVIGPVDEPYLKAFPDPATFFGLLIKGDLTIAQCYAMSIPFRSWRMVLVADPLYKPFQARRKSAESD